MSTWLKPICAIVLTVHVQIHESAQVVGEPWEHIRSFMERDTGRADPEFTTYLRSLTPEEMLTGARQACKEVDRRSGEMRDMPPEAVAELYVMVCLHHYFEKTERDEGASVLLKIVADPKESAFLRQSLISRMFERDEPFDAEFQEYVRANEETVTALLVRLLKDREENPLVRKESVDCLTGRLERHVSMTTVSDANRHAIWEQTRKVVDVGKLVRSGELTLTEDTRKALEPLEAQAVTYVTLLAGVVANEKNEPEQLRKHARRALQRYKRLPFPDLDAKIDQAIQ